MDIISSRHRSALWLARNLDESGDGLALERVVQDMGRTVGVRHVALVMQHVPGVVEENSIVVDTFGEAWCLHWKAEGFDSVDPCRTAATAMAPAVDWKDLPRERLKERRFLRDFQDFQLGKHGLTLMHRGHLGDRSLLTFTSDVTEKRWIALKQEIISAATILHPAVHRFVLRTRFGIEGTIAVRLTPREKECLNWAAHGRTSKEISGTLGLTTATVNFFIDAAVQKLSAANRAHAAAKAVALGLISPPR